MKSLCELVRPNIWNFTPFQCEREKIDDDISCVLLNANESPYNSPYNRYPDPCQVALKKKLVRVKGVNIDNMYIGNDREVVDVLYRCFCRPGVDNVVAMSPSRSVYKVLAEINDVEYKDVPLDDKFQLSAERIIDACDSNTKLIWICTPNDPTGNLMDEDEVRMILDMFDGIVVIDEAYSDFSNARTWRSQLLQFPNMVVLNTMSNSWGCASICLGMAFASKVIIEIFNRIRNPYNVNALTQEMAIKRLDDDFEVEKWVRTVVGERDRMVTAFRLLPFCERVYPTNSNFFLAKVVDAKKVYDYLVKNGIIVWNVKNVQLCEDCLRITIGSKSENNELLSALRQLEFWIK